MANNMDLKVCISEANAFLKVAEKLKEDIGDFLTGEMYPCVVNLSFACELYLKAMIFWDSGTILKKHKLDEVFFILPETIRSQIELSYARGNDGDLNKLLQECSNAFIDWRYAYEDRVTINITGLFTFASVLKVYIIDNIKKGVK